ncbi:DNA N-glycosylase and apurinic/apyrimidinic (AP) lyase [Apophysomyces sp. BC1034]|nr:DNA N-glycosylase and apurinic/apyrimidinic (AP) lyase [Apophysomyces sp. BC1021]KAG0193582.1 DNA N-glycosylase and apurinic/apyrimidinic (AP) lyase [Apophysomyces sp. BC1034]
MSTRRSSRLAKSSADLVQEALVPAVTESRRRRRRQSVSTKTTKTATAIATKVKRVKKEEDTTTTAEAPKNWETVFQHIKEYREKVSAPVDTMGCERLAETDVPAKVSRFQTLIALMLSSQTKDTVTSVAVRKLQKELPGGLCLESILNIDEAVLDDHIRSVGFHTKKAAYIKKTATILRDNYDGDIPDTIEGLTSLPGVGIGVDIHVHRITNRLAWCKTMKGGPEDTRKSLQSWLPKEHWREINPMLVGFGQVTCLPRGPRCFECPVSDLCPSAEIKKVRVKKETIKKEEFEAEETVVKKEGLETEEVTIKKEEVKAEEVIPSPFFNDVPVIKNEPLDW